jgi:hypothetical protein
MVSILYFRFWPWEPKKPKKATLCILDPENFGIFYRINAAMKILVFYILSFQST